MKKLILTLSLLIIYCQLLSASVRYVSHTGSNTPPYLTWETAADSIMSAINLSSFGDTIYVANGVYEEQVVMIPGISLIGAGMDSCVIDTRDFQQSSLFSAVKVKDASLFKGFRVIVSNGTDSQGILSDSANAIIESNRIENTHIGISVRFSNSTIMNNMLQNIVYGIDITNSESLISNNQLVDVIDGISTIAYTYDYYPVIEDNIISCIMHGVFIQFGSRPTIRGNAIFLNGNAATGYHGGGSDTAWVYNNLIVSLINSNLTRGMVNTISTTIEYNNFLIGNFSSYGLYTEDHNIIKNNVIINSPRGIEKPPNSNPVIQYNNSWNNTNNYIGFTPDSTNLSVDPMVVNTDTSQGELDFHLQMFSPLIDRGDPDVLDKDGTRSDIGLFGGPFGEIYTYQDLAPRVPVNFSATMDSNYIRLQWNKNTEADFSHYNLYRDTTENFTADSTTLVVSTTDSFYISIIPEGIDNLYFKLRAVDGQGNVSEPSEELHLALTGTKIDGEYTINDYRLFQNYPNPFNPTTRIGYRLKQRGYVKLYVYDIKGELVQTLVNQYQEGGYYEVEFSGRSEKGSASLASRLASGIYIYQIMVRSENNIPVFSDINKMIYLK